MNRVAPVSGAATASVVLLLRRTAGVSATDVTNALAESRLSGLASPLVMGHEQFVSQTDAERDGRDLPQFAETGYDAVVFLTVGTPDDLPPLIESPALADAVSDLPSWADTATSHAVLTHDRVAFGPGEGEVVTLGCLRRLEQQTWKDFDQRWLTHTRLTDGLRESGLLAGYVQSHLPGPTPEAASFRAGDVELAWAPWDGVTRGFWVDAEALARRSEMGHWLVECEEDERQFIDHGRSCHQLTRRTILT